MENLRVITILIISQYYKLKVSPLMAYLRTTPTPHVIDEVQFVPRKWEKKSKKTDEKTTKLSIAKTYRSTEALFLTFDETPFLPQSRNKGKGRIKTKTKKYKVVKKANISKKKRNKMPN